MKRCLETSLTGKDGEDINDYDPTPKVSLVEMGSNPGGVALVNPNRVAKKTHVEFMELEESQELADTFNHANAMNKMEIIGRQMKNLQELMTDVVKETKMNNQLNHVACNFVKQPGHIYHLYERPSGQKYFGMLSPEEWANAPHQFLGSFRLEVDQSWTPVDEEETRHEGLKFLRDKYLGSMAAKSILSRIDYK